MKKLLLLDNSYRPDTNDIWRTAVSLGWKTERTNMFQVQQHMEGFDLVKYYGNPHHFAQIQPKLNFKYCDINPQWLANLKEYTKRDITLTNYDNFLSIGISRDTFVKPVREKWFEAKVYKPGETLKGEPVAGDEIYQSEIVKFIDEVRCFCFRGEIYTSSLYRINSIVWDATEETPEDINFDRRLNDTPLRQYVKEITEKCNIDFGITMDFGTNAAGEWSLVEFNESLFSGIYYTVPEKAFEVIIESQRENV